MRQPSSFIEALFEAIEEAHARFSDVEDIECEVINTVIPASKEEELEIVTYG